MNIKLFYPSLISCWNHGHAHFLRGIVAELLHRGHQVEVFESTDNRSYEKLIKEQGAEASINFKKHFPKLRANFYYPIGTDFKALVWDADLVIVHESTSRELISLLGALKESFHYQLLFHDSHHRAASAPEALSRLDLSKYNGVLSSGEVIRELYLKNGWAKNAWTWHQAADIRVFFPRTFEPGEATKNKGATRPTETKRKAPSAPGSTQEQGRPKTRESASAGGDLVWIGNWGDEERARELENYLFRPAEELGLKAAVYGVGYPDYALERMQEAGIAYKGWLPNYLVPQVFSQYKLTLHVPRRYYRRSLPGIPGIRPFEALACAIPLISAPWQDHEGLFEIGKDFLMVHSGAEMKQAIRELLQKPAMANELAAHGLQSVRAGHTCAQRVDQLLAISNELNKVSLNHAR